MSIVFKRAAALILPGAYVLCYVLSAAATVIIVMVSGPVAYLLSQSKLMVTWPMASYFLGASLFSYFVSGYMKKDSLHGFVVSTIAGIFGSVVCVFSVLYHSLYVFLLGCFFIGGVRGGSELIRFAITDVLPVCHHRMAVNVVVLSTLFSIVLGGVIVSLGSVVVATPYLGAFLFMLVPLVIVFIILIVVSMFFSKHIKVNEEFVDDSQGIDVDKLRLIFVIIAGVFGYFAMVMIMNLTAVVMEQHHYIMPEIAGIMSLHGVCMYLPSLFLPILNKRVSDMFLLGLGALLFIVACFANVAVSSIFVLSIGLVFLGVAWNFVYVTASHMILYMSKKYKNKRLLGINDSCIWIGDFTAAIFSGWMYSLLGWSGVNMLVVMLATMFLLMAVVLNRKFDVKKNVYS